MRQINESKVVAKAEARAAAMKTIASTVEYGPGLTLTAYEKAIADARAAFAAYNHRLAEVSAVGIDVRIREAALREQSDRMLKAVGAHFGTDSMEFAKAGAVRKSDRRRPARETQA